MLFFFGQWLMGVMFQFCWLWCLLVDGFYWMVRFFIVIGDLWILWLCVNGFIGLLDYVELVVVFNFIDYYWFMQMMVSGIYGQGKIGWCVEGLFGYCFVYFIDIGGVCFGYCLCLYMQIYSGCFYWIVGYYCIGIWQFVCFGICVIIGDKGFVGWIIDGFKVVLCCEVVDQWFGIDVVQFFFFY